jgi:(4S)-4-hydroxy-5-phosphonooxypentane-2,3-dione isomerase
LLTIFVKIQIKPEYREKFIEASLGDGIGSTRDEPGCYRFDVLQDDADPNRIYFYEVYKDEAAFQEHIKQPHYFKWRDTVEGWTAVPTEVVRAHSTFPADDAWRRQG